MLKKNYLILVFFSTVLALGFTALSYKPTEPQKADTLPEPIENRITAKNPIQNITATPTARIVTISQTSPPKEGTSTVKKLYSITDPPEPESKKFKTQPEFQITLQILDQTFSIDVPESSNAYDLMKMAQEKKYLTFTEQKYGGLGYIITEINGIKSSNETKKYWIYYINGQKAKIGISNYKLNSDDVINWKYEDQE